MCSSAFVPSLSVSATASFAGTSTTSFSGNRSPRVALLTNSRRRRPCVIRTPSLPAIRCEQDTPTPTPTPSADTDAGATDTSTTSASSTPTPTPISTPASTPAAAAAAEALEEKPKPPFEIRGFSLANLFLAAGGVITLVSFSSYFNSAGTASVTSLGFVYGVPILLVGCALKYAELQPIPVTSDDGAREARLQYATDTQKQIYKDITRHRYGDEAHLSSAMSSLGLIPRGEPCPILERATERAGVHADDEGGEPFYEVELVFCSVATPYKTWVERMDRYDRFFGPNVTVSVKKVDAAKRLVALVIRSQTKSTTAGTE